MITSENQNSQDTLSFEIANKTINFKKETFDIEMERVWCFSLTRDNQFLVVGGWNSKKQFHIYQDKRPFQLLKKVYAGTNLVYDVQFSSKDQFLCVGCSYEQVLIWNFNHLVNYEKPHPLQIQKPMFQKIKYQFTPDESYLCFQDSTKIQFWNMEEEIIQKNINIDENFESFKIKQKAVYVLGKNNLIQIIFLPKSKILKRILLSEEEKESIDVCEDKFLIMYASTSKIFIINNQSGKIIRKYKTSNYVIKVAFLNDTQYFSCYTKSANWNEPDCIQIIEISTFKILLKYPIQSHAHLFQFKPQKFFIANKNQLEVWKPIE